MRKQGHSEKEPGPNDFFPGRAFFPGIGKEKKERHQCPVLVDEADPKSRVEIPPDGPLGMKYKNRAATSKPLCLCKESGYRARPKRPTDQGTNNVERTTQNLNEGAGENSFCVAAISQ